MAEIARKEREWVEYADLMLMGPLFGEMDVFCGTEMPARHDKQSALVGGVGRETVCPFACVYCALAGRRGALIKRTYLLCVPTKGASSGSNHSWRQRRPGLPREVK